MLRIGTKPTRVPPGPPPEDPNEDPQPLQEQEESVSSPEVIPDTAEGDQETHSSGGGVLDQSVVVYMTSDYGPFECQRCVHWVEPNACQVVSGEIDPKGCCNVFEPAGGEEAGETYGAPEDESTEPQTIPQEGQ